MRTRLRRAPRKVLTGFDRSRYGFDTIRVYFDRDVPPETERGLSSSGTLRLLVEQHAAGNSRWWRLELADAGGDHLDLLSIEDEPQDTEAAEPATPDAALPLVKVSYSSRQQGANTSAEVARTLLLDFRAAPRVVTALESVVVEGGGACGVWDNGSSALHKIGCRWDAARNDFLCRETMHRRDTGWSPMRGSRWFYLDSAAIPAPPGINGPATLEAFAADLAKDASAPRSAMLPSLGHVEVLADLPPARGQSGRRFLFGAPAMTAPLQARFFVASVSGGADVRVVPASVMALDDSEADADAVAIETAKAFTPDGPPPSYSLQWLEEDGPVRIARILVTQGSGHALYFVGVDAAPGGMVAALRASTDTSFYAGCGTMATPPAAVDVQISSRPFSARLDVEPGRSENAEGDLTGDEEGPCPAIRTLRWEAGQGFVLDAATPGATCPGTVPRRVVFVDGRVEDAGGTSVTGSKAEDVSFHAKGRGAPAIVFLSDWLADGMQTWDRQIDAVSTSRMAVVPLRSGTPDIDGAGNTIDALASNALRVITHLSLEKPILVGHGMGARVALEISRRGPDSVGGLVLVNFTRAANLETFLTFLASDHAAQKEIVRGRLSPAAPDDLVSAITFMLSGRMGYQKLPGAASAISYATYPVYDALTSGVRVPIRVIASAEDPALAAMAGGRLRWILIPTQGEFPMLEAPEVFTRALMKAIEELTAVR